MDDKFEDLSHNAEEKGKGENTEIQISKISILRT